MNHGTLTGYVRDKCRKTCCRTVWNTYTRHKRQQRAHHIPNHVHGTVNGYSNYLCRCPPCSAAQTHCRNHITPDPLDDFYTAAQRANNLNRKATDV